MPDATEDIEVFATADGDTKVEDDGPMKLEGDDNSVNEEVDGVETASGDEDGGGEIEDAEEEIKEDAPNYDDDDDGDTPSKKKRQAESADATPTITNNADDDGPLPTLPLKKARTAYFIFAQDKREELKQKYQGEGVAAISKATGALWAALEQDQKDVYEDQAAQERKLYLKDKQRLINAGCWPESSSNDVSGGGAAGAGEYDEEAILFPVGRIRKICKLDSDVKGMSKEATLLVAKATELFAVKLGSEVVTMAQMSNRRKLLPDDVVEVCSLRERFMFLKDDLVDLRNEQKEIEKKEKENEKESIGVGRDKSGKLDKSDGENKGVSSLLSYFGKIHND
jgi:histone H3/H4